MTLTTKSAHRKDLNAGLGPMQHRHFATVAAIIRGGNNYPDETARRMVALDFADALAATNPRFDRARFLAACAVMP